MSQRFHVLTLTACVLGTLALGTTPGQAAPTHAKTPASAVTLDNPFITTCRIGYRESDGTPIASADPDFADCTPEPTGGPTRVTFTTYEDFATRENLGTNVTFNCTDVVSIPPSTPSGNYNFMGCTPA
ncbi:hypothetical protein ACFWAR_14330 [Streptomyces sp. NPDC059917]|uniref:hypothetical protein n=1 Tax=Streptomyces sp. NPDC059917 TaxID=3347002 RepID=UPI00365B7220